MGRLFRIMWYCMSALSLLLCIAASWLWVRGYEKGDLIAWTWELADEKGYSFQKLYFESGAGTLSVRFTSYAGDKAGMRDAAYEIADSRVPDGPEVTTPYSPRPDVRFYQSVDPPMGTISRWQLDKLPANSPLGWVWRRYGILIEKTQDSTSYGALPTHIFHCNSYTRTLVVPNWMVMVVTAIAPGWMGLGLLFRRNFKGPGTCRRCGYDLRATPEQCPECGEVTARG